MAGGERHCFDGRSGVAGESGSGCGLGWDGVEDGVRDGCGGQGGCDFVYADEVCTAEDGGDVGGGGGVAEGFWGGLGVGGGVGEGIGYGLGEEAFA